MCVTLTDDDIDGKGDGLVCERKNMVCMATGVGRVAVQNKYFKP